VLQAHQEYWYQQQCLDQQQGVYQQHEQHETHAPAPSLLFGPAGCPPRRVVVEVECGLTEEELGVEAPAQPEWWAGVAAAQEWHESSDNSGLSYHIESEEEEGDVDVEMDLEENGDYIEEAYVREWGQDAEERRVRLISIGMKGRGLILFCRRWPAWDRRSGRIGAIIIWGGQRCEGGQRCRDARRPPHWRRSRARGPPPRSRSRMRHPRRLRRRTLTWGPSPHRPPRTIRHGQIRIQRHRRTRKQIRIQKRWTTTTAASTPSHLIPPTGVPATSPPILVLMLALPRTLGLGAALRARAAGSSTPWRGSSDVSALEIESPVLPFLQFFCSLFVFSNLFSFPFVFLLTLAGCLLTSPFTLICISSPCRIDRKSPPAHVSNILGLNSGRDCVIRTVREEDTCVLLFRKEKGISRDWEEPGSEIRMQAVVPYLHEPKFRSGEKD
jgi:hypothetical protein